MAKTRKTMRIPRPIAAIGEAVEVPNYRRKGRWEDGTIERAEFCLRSGYWSYTVMLDRKTTPNRHGDTYPLRLYVSDRFNAPERTGAHP